ncbi:MAG: HAD hydrolase-like protein [Chitinophagaceae bacterium]
MTNKIELAVFDIAGTTLKDNGEIVAAFQAAFLHYGYNVPAEKVNLLMGYKKPEAIELILQEVEMNPGKITQPFIHEIHDKFTGVMKEHYSTTETLLPLPHAIQTFSYLKQRNIKIGLSTGFSNDITHVIMERLGWLKDHLVDFVVSSNEVAAGRPHPFMIQKLMQLCQVADAKNVIKTGDTEVDVHEGINAGCLYSIAVTTGSFTRRELEPHHPSFIIDHLSELIPIIDNHT